MLSTTAIAWCVTMTMAIAVNGESCESCAAIPKHYDELGCKPIIDEGKCCPSRYECPELPDDGKCHYNKKVYEMNVKLPEDEHPQCLVGCRCKNLYPTNRTTIECVSIECPQDLSPDSDCLYLRRKGQCCADVICDKTDIENSKAIKCYYDEKEYEDGQEIHPNDQVVCYCGKGFDNSTLTNNTHCEKPKRKLDCNIPLHYFSQLRDGCIPIYYENATGCPIELICPTDTDEKVDEAQSKSNAQPACTYGKLNFALNEQLKHPKSCVTCGCWTPPMIHCIQNGNC